MKKRGQGNTLWTVIGLVLAAVVILLLTYVAITFSDIFVGPSAFEQAAINNFDVLTEKVKELTANNKQFDTRSIQYNIPNGYILVGFDYIWYGDGTDDTEDSVAGPFEASVCHDEGIDKPPQCLGKACLCLYKDTIGDDFKEDDSPDELIKCQTYEGQAYISGPKDNPDKGDYSDDYPNDGAAKYYPPANYYPNAEYEFLVVYGECDDAWGIRPLYIEKYVDDKNIYIFISEETEETKKRKIWLEK